MLNIKEILSRNWSDYRKDLCPIDRRMAVLREKYISGMSTENIRFLMNEIVRIHASEATYLEVGTFAGCSLLSAALYNPSTRCIGVDNFSLFNPENKNQEVLAVNIKKFPALKNIEFHEGSYTEVLEQLFAKEPDLKIKMYFYDGHHIYEDQSKGLRIMLPYLTEDCIIIVDDINLPEVEKANADFLQENPEFKSIFSIKTKGNCSEDWWNGFEVIVRCKP